MCFLQRRILSRGLLVMLAAPEDPYHFVFIFFFFFHTHEMQNFLAQGRNVHLSGIPTPELTMTDP